MILTDTNINNIAKEFLLNLVNAEASIDMLNAEIETVCGIRDFFANSGELDAFRQTISNRQETIHDRNKVEYGDFQTNLNLARSVCSQINPQNNEPLVLVEPTCGKGHFIIAALDTYQSICSIIGIEIYQPYVWEAKLNILEYFLKNDRNRKPSIRIIHANVFDYSFIGLKKEFKSSNFLIIGNPPWVTNSGLGKIASTNLPKKVNINKTSGIEALTGKGNFDIAESIVLRLIDAFGDSNATIGLLVKNSVIKNLMYYQHKKKYPIRNIKKFNIDAKKEFDVSVGASLLYAEIDNQYSLQCREYDLYSNQYLKSFGWAEDKFISDIDEYSSNIEGVCQIEWRQGIKHDCSEIMDFEIFGDRFTNSKGDVFDLETDLVYGLIKSSDLKHRVVDSVRKYTIVTQSFIGQDTEYLEKKYPKVFKYLDANRSRFNSRKSSIYSGKAPFSIFGIGDYSFKPYKVAISGLYKKPDFSLIMPLQSKPTMLDDTCYFIGFDILEYAVFSMILLNSSITKKFLNSIVFLDSKRPYTKDILMRIDLFAIATLISFSEVEISFNQIKHEKLSDIDITLWDSYLSSVFRNTKNQLALFETT